MRATTMGLGLALGALCAAASLVQGTRLGVVYGVVLFAAASLIWVSQVLAGASFLAVGVGALATPFTYHGASPLFYVWGAAGIILTVFAGLAWAEDVRDEQGFRTKEDDERERFERGRPWWQRYRH